MHQKVSSNSLVCGSLSQPYHFLPPPICRNVMGYTIEETVNLQRNLPLSLLIGVPIVTVGYLLVNMSYFAVLSYQEILNADAVALVSG